MDNPLLDRYIRMVEVSRDIASILDLDVLLFRVVQAAADVTEATAASILLYDESNNQLYFQASTNLDSHVMRGLVVPVKGSLAGTIVTSREPLIVQDTDTDPRHFEGIGQTTNFDTSSLLGVPLIHYGKVIGVLEALNKRDGTFNAEDIELLSGLGAQAAIAIENARLFQQSDLISEMVHELRTPLASINTAAHLLMRPEISADQRSMMTETIQKETQRLSEMATSFLDLARLESGRSQFQVHPFELRPILLDSINVMQGRITQKGLSLEQSIPDELPLLHGDADKIKQVVLNLLSNAIKYNRPDGVITLTCRVEDEHVLCAVEDTGRGILPEHMQGLFQKFYRVPGSEQIAEGTGLGLSICKKIIEAHGGEIKADSEPGVGTTFSFVLPYSSPETLPA
ncbi:MAG: GAF domain-containing sensor histidine kinase [Anaerolineales bacterium]|nr:GAF domain-containing sensor histidine kinase [Anaerolineales bacterium]